MVKGSGKSSASSGTRKKHAKKAASRLGEEPEPVQQKQKKEKGKKGPKKEPKQKVYIAPVKPAPVRPDPLETAGLLHQLPPELVVSLRSLSKKAGVTKGKALEELQFVWADPVVKGQSENDYVLVDMLPVWLHHLPSLFIHPARRIRLLTATLHDTFLKIPPIRDQIIFSLTESLDEDQISSIVGTWCIAVHDIDRAVSHASLEPWNRFISLLADDRSRGNIIKSLQSFVQRAALDPIGVYVYLNPAPHSKKARTPINVSRSETPDGESRARPEDEESEQDRKARIRVGAFGSLAWILDHRKPPMSDLGSFFSDHALWSSLHHAPICPFWAHGAQESFGAGQPNVRKTAWTLMHALLKGVKASNEPIPERLLSTLSTAVLRSAWVEPDTAVHQTMWHPLLLFLKEYPNSWKIDSNHAAQDDSDSDAEDSEDEEAEESTKPKQPPELKPAAYEEFLQFLQLGCGGSPLQGYPTVVIILSTIPSSIIASARSQNPLDDLFTSFWAAIDGRALSSLQRSATSAAFLEALLECLVFLVRRIWRDRETASSGQSDSSAERISAILGASDAEQGAQTLIKSQIERVWTELAGSTLKVEPKRAGVALNKVLLEGLDKIDNGLWLHAWETLSGAIKRLVLTSSPTLTCTILGVLLTQSVEQRQLDAARDLLLNTLNAVLEDGAYDLKAKKPNIDFLVAAMQTLGNEIYGDEGFAARIDDLIISNAYRLVSDSSSPLLTTYLSTRSDETQRQRCWHRLVSDVAQHPEAFSPNLARLLDVVEGSNGQLNSLRPESDELDSLTSRLLVDALGGSGTNHVALLRRVIANPAPILSTNGQHGLFQSLVSAFSLQLDTALHDENVPLASFNVVLDLLAVTMQQRQNALALTVQPDIFLFAYLLPKCYDDHDSSSSFSVAQRIWDEWEKRANREERASVHEQVKGRLMSILTDVSVRPLPLHVIQVFKVSLAFSTLALNPLHLLPSEEDMNAILDGIPSDPINASLAVLDSLIPPASMFSDEEQSVSTPEVDSRGYTLYGRLATALLHIALDNRLLAKSNVWILRHLLALSLYAEDLINVPTANSPIFDKKALNFDLSDLIVKVHQIATYVLTSGDNEDCTRNALDVLTGKTKSEAGLSAKARFLVDLIRSSQATETIREFRVLSYVLQHLFDDVEREEAELWTGFARTIEKSAPNTSIAVLSAISVFGSEPSRLERYRNELAASLLGVHASKADTEGLMILRKLAAVAPPAESDVEFLPQQRAVNVMKACQQWISSDEDDVGEEVECAMTLTFFHLAPILQHVPGGHWAFIFDVIENNLENSVMLDESTLVTLARTLRLVILIRDLASTNKVLRADWQERETTILKAVRDLATSQLDPETPSAPVSTCRELILSIAQNLPPSLVDHESLSKMCHLLSDPSVDVQKMAYQLLQQAAKKHTEHLVIEAGVDTEDKFKAELPPELVVILQQNLNIGYSEEAEQEQPVFGYLLGWMLLFDLFIDTSLKVRSAYVDQLRNLEIISTHFIPTILGLLGVDRGIPKAFKLDVWAVEEYYVPFYEPGTSFSLRVLAGHLYYRALLTIPSIIYSWVLDCKDRQLSSAIGTYTSSYFSPVIIKAELAHVKSPEAISELADDNLTIKVASSVNEVAAAYLVDEHQLEIKIKIPNDWPLHRIEIRDVKRVGVDENRWRAWILAVQQTMWAQNGRIVDGLALFKKNVTLHFEGQVECAICYSIISVMDGSLPKKRCRTCKNRFHAACLYRWINTSHSSSCPLCRSDILH
ncbi:delta 9-fatty acid desaturase [Moniliophthora roreri]|nr:delta 9-fatty acid desaturase [Moniliophthora roreri]